MAEIDRNSTGRGGGTGKGRAKGTPNRTTREIKEIVLEALDRLGGPEYLERVGLEKPEVFCQLLARVIPSQIKAELETEERRPSGIVVLPAQLSFEEWTAKHASDPAAALEQVREIMEKGEADA
jgi:hypothetical protein